jgi:hypothetical protein
MATVSPSAGFARWLRRELHGIDTGCRSFQDVHFLQKLESKKLLVSKRHLIWLVCLALLQEKFVIGPIDLQVPQQ